MASIEEAIKNASYNELQNMKAAFKAYQRTGDRDYLTEALEILRSNGWDDDEPDEAIKVLVKKF